MQAARTLGEKGAVAAQHLDVPVLVDRQPVPRQQRGGLVLLRLFCVCVLCLGVFVLVRVQQQTNDWGEMLVVGWVGGL